MAPPSSQHSDEASGGMLARLRAKLRGTREKLGQELSTLFTRGQWDEAAREEAEAKLLLADVGVDATEWLLARVESATSSSSSDPNDKLQLLRENMLELLLDAEKPLIIDSTAKPFVILVVGVNGTGKTTTIGKLAQLLKANGHSVMLAAGDTFRAAAVEQLNHWAERTGSQIVAQAHGADPAAVVYDTLESARARKIDVVIADTAGRLHTADGLMDELRKIKRVMGKIDADIPHETLLVLDATQGQNSLVQATEFHNAVGLTGLIVTKLDGTAKGGILLAVARELKLPVRFLGVGEGVDDLQQFNAREYTNALLGDQ
jgi:fused signal recognition particle receptor